MLGTLCEQKETEASPLREPPHTASLPNFVQVFLCLYIRSIARKHVSANPGTAGQRVSAQVAPFCEATALQLHLCVNTNDLGNKNRYQTVAQGMPGQGARFVFMA